MASTFMWTKQRKDALQLVIDGLSDKTISERLGCHKNTIYNWRHSTEFIEALKEKMDEYAARTKLKRVRETGMLTDVLAAKLATALQADDLGKVSVYGREYHAFRGEERQDFGDNVRRVEGHLQINGQHNVNVNHTNNVSFKKFLEERADIIDVTPVLQAGTPQLALQEMAAQLLQNSELLDTLQEEDKVTSE